VSTKDDHSASRKVRAHAGLAVIAWAALLSSLAACNAHIQKFEVAPRHICAGQDVTIAWEVKGQANLSVVPRPPNAPEGSVASSGTTTIRPNANARVSLRATRFMGKSDGADMDIALVAPVEIAASLQDVVSCQDNTLILRTETKGFGPSLRSEMVGANKRAMDVARVDDAGRTISAHVTPGGPATSAFAALPMNGQWTLTTKLGGGESCSDPPRALTLIVHTDCDGERP
jgi:hypothetical protein